LRSGFSDRQRLNSFGPARKMLQSAPTRDKKLAPASNLENL
jgi:hypothetical protein